MRRILAGLIAIGLVAGGYPAGSGGARVQLLQAPAGSAAGGGPAAAAGGITADISIGDGIAGGVTTSGGIAAKGNLIGQLYDVRALAVSAQPPSVDEGATRQMTAVTTLDDATDLVVPPAEVAWRASGPFLSGIDTAGVVTAGRVYQDQPTQRIDGVYQGVNDADGFELTVLNVVPDDFGTYAGDGIDDDWQIAFFGQDNTLAGPGENPDGDDDDNLHEFLFGFSPVDPAEFFRFELTGAGGATATLALNKVLPGRTYHLLESGNLTEGFTEVLSFSPAVEETDRLVTDPDPPALRNAYRIAVTRP